ncbi:MAG: lysophospholipid acyltransferase family protein [Planctomycetota bacterium]|jgi:KDO2-lipid IV(A) lauroyltransferase
MGPSPRSFPLRVLDAVLFHGLQGTASVLRALPSRWILALGDAVGEFVAFIDRRGRRASRQNMDVVFGSDRSDAEKRRIFRAAMRTTVRSVFLMIHVSPMTPERLRRWVEVPDDVYAAFRESTQGGTRGGVVVGGHLGNWELLLGINDLLPGIPRAVYLAEALSSPALDRFFESLRGSGGSTMALRKGGARALRSHVRKGGAAAILADRNVMRAHGGVWVPFFGLPARTTPLPGWLALKHRIHVRPIFCLPVPGGRYRIRTGPNLAEGLYDGDFDEGVVEIMNRFHRILEDLIRERPELWNWMLKRFKSRPHQELGPYPPYSLWDPDR